MSILSSSGPGRVCGASSDGEAPDSRRDRGSCSSPPWPWAVGVVVVPSAVVDRRQALEYRLAVATEAYKLGRFLVDTLTVSAEHAAVDLNDVRVMARRATADLLIVLDTCAGGHLIDLAMPDEVTIHTLTPLEPSAHRHLNTTTTE